MDDDTKLYKDPKYTKLYKDPKDYYMYIPHINGTFRMSDISNYKSSIKKE